MKQRRREKDKSFPIFLTISHDHCHWQPPQTPFGLIYDAVGELVQTPSGAVRRVVSGFVYNTVGELVQTPSSAVRGVVSGLVDGQLIQMTFGAVRRVVSGHVYSAVVQPTDTTTSVVCLSSFPASSTTPSSSS
ncbi:hypothetical protein CFC21_052827 [Triticum aestivum]|uniref:Uncharacterized protein n=2 Tax=Triticum aestivum TaxID=4565 RepID=A0A3B6HYJ3_WHEAT|nr:hypothetical protein CFC21_052827 [Triticum aestivum]